MMQNKNITTVIYRLWNIETGKTYIESTTRDVQTRVNEHFKAAENNSPYPIHQAIATYGPEAFHWHHLDSAYSIDELAEKEKRYILEFNSQRNGYNVDLGGGFKKTVYQYEKSTGKLLDTHMCLEDAANSNPDNKQGIERACLSSTNSYAGFYWSYKYDNPFVSGKDRRLKEVRQIDLKNNWVANYRSVAEASRMTGIGKNSIAKVCRRESKQSHGFIFSYVD